MRHNILLNVCFVRKKLKDIIYMFGVFSVRQFLVRIFDLSVLWLLELSNDFHKVFVYFQTETSHIHNAYSIIK